jgi:hypothetical protein
LILILILALALAQTIMSKPQIYFDHEKLIAYQWSIQFVAWSNKLLEEVPAKLAVSDQP